MGAKDRVLGDFMQARNAAAIFTVCGMMLAPPLSSQADASPSRSATKHVSSAQPDRGAASDIASGRALRNAGAKAGSRRDESESAPAIVTGAYMPRAGTFGGISCVPYARMVSGIDVTGNGGTWWNNAAGLYQRGHRPEPGAVLVFRSSGGMRSGHVAVVERQVSSREITIHHANWEGPGIRKGTVTRNIAVVDVSDANDWTEVRVQVGREPGAFGRNYPTYGFIFNRPDFTAPGATPRGPVMVRAGREMQEVAEAPAATPHLRFINTSFGGLGVESSR